MYCFSAASIVRTCIFGKLGDDILIGYRGLSLTTPTGLRQHLFEVRLHVEVKDEDRLW